MTVKVEREALLRVLERTPVNTQLDSDYLVVDYGNLIGDEKLKVDDEDSVYTLSTASFSDTDSEEDASVEERRVSFSEELVTDEWTRPFTAKEDLPQLFYTTEETQRFRQEYRMERKLLTELSIDPSTFPVDDNKGLSDLVATSTTQKHRHSISRVVVLHNDKLETFFTPKPKTHKIQDAEVFFDNDSFWSGSITWY